MASTPASTSHLQTCDRVLDGVARRLRPEEEQRVVVLGGADLHLQVEVAADLRADRPDDLDDEPGAVLERPAVLVRAVVDRRAEELRDQVAVRAVQLDAVEARLARAPGAFGERGRRSRGCRRSSSRWHSNPWSGSFLSVELRP